MKIQVKMLGSLAQQHPGYDPHTELFIDLPDDSTVRDLLEHLNLSTSGDNVVIGDGRVLKSRDRLHASCCISVFPIVHGG